MANDNVTRKVNIYINGQEVVNSLSGINREIAKVNGQIKNLNKGAEDYDETLKKHQSTLKQLKELQEDYKEELYGTEEAMQAASGAWTNLMGGLVTGNLTLAASGMTALKTGIISTTKAMLAFIATPIGATITALAGIALTTKEWFEYNKEVAKANQETAAITKLSGDALDETRINAKALADTFEVDFKEVLEAAGALVKEFDISYTEALKRIENGLIKGGAANSGFLEIMREYPTFFAQAGYSVKEFQNLINSGIDEKIFKDKLPDAIKEFALSVNEQEPAVREALENAFGTEFTDKLLKGVKDGSLSVKQALEQVSAEAKRLGLNAQQAQQLTAALFRGAGEDAGGALKIFNAVTQSIENQKRPLTEVEQAMQDLADSEKELAKAQDQFLKSDGFAIWEKNIKEKLNSISTEFYKFLYVMSNSSEQVAKDTFKEAFKVTEEQQKQFIEDSEKSFAAYAERQKKILGSNFNQNTVLQDYLAIQNQILEESTDENYKQLLSATIKHFDDQQKVINKNNIDLINARRKANEERLKEIEAQTKKEQDAASRALETWTEAYLKAEEEINKIIAQSQKDREAAKLKGLQKEIYQIENKYAAEIEKFKEHTDRLIELEAARDQEIADAKAAKALEYGLQIDEINAQLERDREAHRLEKESDKAETDEEKQLLLVEKAKMLADWEIQSEQEKELAKVEEVENAEALKQAIRDKYALKKQQNDEKFAKAEKEIQSDVVDWTKLTEEQKLNATRSALNSASEAFNKGSEAWKAIKIAETTIATYQSAVNAFNSLAGIPFVGPTLGAAAAALAVVTGLKQVQNIAKTKIEKAPKFFYGGHTGSNAIAYDENGPITGVVHKNEWVAPEAMTQNPRYANVIGWLEGERVRMKGYADGGFTSDNASVTSSDSFSVQTQSSSSGLEDTLKSILFRLENPVSPVLQIGYSEVRDLNKVSQEINRSTENGKLN